MEVLGDNGILPDETRLLFLLDEGSATLSIFRVDPSTFEVLNNLAYEESRRLSFSIKSGASEEEKLEDLSKEIANVVEERTQDIGKVHVQALSLPMIII